MYVETIKRAKGEVEKIGGFHIHNYSIVLTAYQIIIGTNHENQSTSAPVVQSQYQRIDF